MAACREELTVTADMIQSTGLEYYVATQGEETIGFYALASGSPQEWELEALFVEPRMIGTGAGKTLLHHAAARARASGVSAMEIQGDPHAEGFYLAMGATPVGFRESQSIPGRQLPVYRLNLYVNGECPGPHA